MLIFFGLMFFSGIFWQLMAFAARSSSVAPSMWRMDYSGFCWALVGLLGMLCITVTAIP